MCELLVCLPEVNVLGVGDWPQFLRIAITTRAERPVCPGGGGAVWLHDLIEVELVDLQCFGRQARLIWTKERWRCPNAACDVVTFVEFDYRISGQRAAITDRAGRWATFQVDRHGRVVSGVAEDLGCDSHTVTHAVMHRGRRLIGGPNRIGTTTAVGLDEVLPCRLGQFRDRCWPTQVVDVAHGQLPNVAPGRDAASTCAWFAERPAELV